MRGKELDNRQDGPATTVSQAKCFCLCLPNLWGKGSVGTNGLTGYNCPFPSSSEANEYLPSPFQMHIGVCFWIGKHLKLMLEFYQSLRVFGLVPQQIMCISNAIISLKTVLYDIKFTTKKKKKMDQCEEEQVCVQNDLHFDMFKSNITKFHNVSTLKQHKKSWFILSSWFKSQTCKFDQARLFTETDAIEMHSSVLQMRL